MIDYREDKNAETGLFELAYKQRMPSCQPYLGAALSLQGTKITTCERKPSPTSQESQVNMVSKSPMVRVNKYDSLLVQATGDLLYILDNET